MPITMYHSNFVTAYFKGPAHYCSTLPRGRSNTAYRTHRRGTVYSTESKEPQGDIAIAIWNLSKFKLIAAGVFRQVASAADSALTASIPRYQPRGYLSTNYLSSVLERLDPLSPSLSVSLSPSHQLFSVC